MIMYINIRHWKVLNEKLRFSVRLHYRYPQIRGFDSLPKTVYVQT